MNWMGCCRKAGLGALAVAMLWLTGCAAQAPRKDLVTDSDLTKSDRAAELHMELASAYFSRGNLLRQTGQHLFALTDYEKAIQFKYPEPARVYYQEALAYEALGRPANARAALGQLGHRQTVRTGVLAAVRAHGTEGTDGGGALHENRVDRRHVADFAATGRATNRS